MGTQRIDTIQAEQLVTLQSNMLELKTKLNLMVDDVLTITTKVNVVIGDMNDMNDVVMKGYTPPQNPANNRGILQSMDIWKDDMTDHHEKFTGLWGFENGTWPGGGMGTWECCAVATPRNRGPHWNCQGPYPPLSTFPGGAHPASHNPNASYPNAGLKQGHQGHGLGGWPGSHNPPEPYDVEMFPYNGSYYADNHMFWVEHPPGVLHDCGSPVGNTHRTLGDGADDSGTSGYDAPVVDGTDQSGNTTHSADAAASTADGNYPGQEIRPVGVSGNSANRAKKLVRNILKKLRKT
jgi:hypothetical protein